MIKHTLGNLSSSSNGTCIICNKRCPTFVTINKVNTDDSNGTVYGTEIRIPVCNEHFDEIVSYKELLVGYAKQIDKTIKSLNKIKKEMK